MKKLALLLLLISTSLYSQEWLAPMVLSQSNEIQFEALVGDFQNSLDGKTIVTKKGNFTLTTEINENGTLFIHLTKGDFTDPSAAMGIGHSGIDIELGNLQGLGIASQIVDYIKGDIPYGTVSENLVVNDPTVKFLMTAKIKTMADLETLFLTTPIGKLLSRLGFDTYEFMVYEDNNPKEFAINKDNVKKFQEGISKFGHFSCISSKQ